MGKQKLFFSHCSSDRDIMDAVISTRGTLEKYFDIFCTYDIGLELGTARGDEIRRNLLDSDCMIAFITDSYLRSVICLSEISVFWGRGMPIIPIVYNGETGRAFLKQLTGKDQMLFDVRQRTGGEIIHELSAVLKTGEDSVSCASSWVKARQGDPDSSDGQTPRPYIGSDRQYRNVFQYCLKSGICRMQDTGLPGEVFREKLINKKEIYLIGTTHKGMIAGNTRLFSEILANGADITILIANRDHDFCRDVAAIESFPSRVGDERLWKKTAAKQKRRLGSEFDTVQDNLEYIYSEAKAMAARSGKKLGHLYLGNAFTLIRQTITMGIDHDKNELWAWMSVTIPPKRASDGTMGIEVESKADNGDDTYRSLAENLAEHAREMCMVARMRHSLYEITDTSDMLDEFYEEDTEDNEGNKPESDRGAARKIWEGYHREAVRNMREHEANSDKALIEIAAQHPLRNGTVPGEAFAARLDEGIRLYKRLRGQGTECRIFIPGSLHLGDEISLSRAGIDYILATGEVDPGDIIDESVNERIKGNLGVYNSADECYVSAELFLKGDYRQLWCICSANQMLRKKLFYIRFGVIAKICTVPDDAFHSDMDEIFDAIPTVLYEDHDWQGRESVQAIRTRIERMPDFQNSLTGEKQTDC